MTNPMSDTLSELRRMSAIFAVIIRGAGGRETSLRRSQRGVPRAEDISCLSHPLEVMNAI
jgi:hypothetical protein